MIGIPYTRREAIAQLCAVDVLTGKVLINHLVAPPVDVKLVSQWRTNITNITPRTMEKAILNNTALQGVEGAREALFKYVDADTVLVGHSLQNDLEVLGMEHFNVVDSQILLCNPGKEGWRISLKDACRGLVKREIQNHGAGKHGHNCREDVMATRELVILYTKDAKMVKDWAQKKISAKD